MSDIQIMNTNMLEILKNYFEICSFFNEKLEEIKADEVLNINLELLKASIMDLNINIANFKSDLKYNEKKYNEKNKKETQPSDQISDQYQTNETNQLSRSIDNYTEFDKKHLPALFFMYLMQIDKDSILNNSNYTSNTSTTSNTNNIINKFEEIELD